MKPMENFNLHRGVVPLIIHNVQDAIDQPILEGKSNLNMCQIFSAYLNAGANIVGLYYTLSMTSKA